LKKLLTKNKFFYPSKDIIIKIITMNSHKILFSGLSESLSENLKMLFQREEQQVLFSPIEKAIEVINTENPSLVVTGDISEKDKIAKLRKITSEKKIPLISIIAENKIQSYIMACYNSYDGIITTPVAKKEFFKFLRTFIKKEPFFQKEIKNHDKLHPFTESLIANLISQNRLARKLIADKKISRSIKKEEQNLKKERETENLLWESLENNYFRLYYQPVISLTTDRLSGFESLIRIEHPQKGLIPPDKFISVAENSAIIFPLGLCIIEEACWQIKQWEQKFLFDDHFRINVNLSAKQFIHPDLIKNIFEIVDKYSISHERLGFELTESAFMEDMEAANMALLQLRSRKFPIYMDDFGTGYSSLSYLMHFPVDIIKIDQSFVKWMHIDEQSEIIVRSIVNLAHNLNLKVVAEGVDDALHIDILKDCTCDYGQGYYFEKPMPSVAAEKFIATYFTAIV